MHSEIIGESFNFRLRNAAQLSFVRDSEYTDIISPFSRIYLITEGYGHLNIENRKIILEPGFLYLIPRFTPCTYLFRAELCHYYAHFHIDNPNGLSPYFTYPIANKVKANKLDQHLFDRLLEIDPDLQLPHHHPNVYQSKLWLTQNVNYHSASQYFETIGILKQLYSRFLGQERKSSVSALIRYNIQPVLLYIQKNLKNEIKVTELADLACLSKDHFSKIFKSIMGMPPCDYIIRQRIKRSQFLLLTTDYSIDEIITLTGFKTASYFCRIFKKFTSNTPAKFRNKRG